MRVPLTEDPLSSDQNPADGLFPAPSTEIVAKWKVACSGDESLGLGHPRVWLAISPAMGWVDCPYCDKRFIVDSLRAGEDL